MEKLKHPKFGTGTILKEDSDAITIHFENFGSKHLLKKYAMLTNEDGSPYLGGETKIAEPVAEKQRKIFNVDNQKKQDLKKQNAQAKRIASGKNLTIKDKVIAAKDVLLEMKTNAALRAWAISNGMDNRAAFPKFKLALNEIGLDYDEIKTGISKASTDKLISEITHEVTLYSDAKASHNRFGITDEDGNPLWYGKFFDNDTDYNGEQSSGELAAAKKAVWLAGKIKESIGAKAIRLNLMIDAQWLTYQEHSGQKGYALSLLAKKHNIELNVQWIPGKDNPADEYTVSSGFKKWSDNDLSAVANLIAPEKFEAQKLEPKQIIEEKVIVGAEINFCEVVKETDKAINVKMRIGFEGSTKTKEVDVWIPKSLSEIKDGKLIVDAKFWENKEKEITDKEIFISINSGFTEYDKSYGVSVVTEEIHTNQELRGKIFFPKSMSEISSEGKLIVPKWLLNKKLEEAADEKRTGAYQYVSSITTYLSGGYSEIHAKVIDCADWGKTEVVQVQEDETEIAEWKDAISTMDMLISLSVSKKELTEWQDACDTLYMLLSENKK